MRDITLQLPNLELAGWRGGDGPPLLMLHGWMDNAASFQPLLPHLKNYDWVALEHAGHGHSQHRPPGHWYHLMDYVADTLAAADALGWERFYLLGHSLGGAVSTLVSAAAPERIMALGTIDGLGPLSGDSRKIDQRLQRSWHQLRRADPSRLRRFDSIDEAVEARMMRNQIEPKALRALVERGLQRDGEHWVWRSDPRLNITTPYRFDETQIVHLLAAIRCPTLAVIADPPSPLLSQHDFERRLAALRQSKVSTLPGGHHLHMNHPELLAPLLIDHFQDGERPS
ncbi:MAG: alpha/beta hydrolase [Wenzhouxiangellaceae bacterium]